MPTNPLTNKPVLTPAQIEQADQTHAGTVAAKVLEEQVQRVPFHTRSHPKLKMLGYIVGNVFTLGALSWHAKRYSESQLMSKTAASRTSPSRWDRIRQDWAQSHMNLKDSSSAIVRGLEFAGGTANPLAQLLGDASRRLMNTLGSRKLKAAHPEELYETKIRQSPCNIDALKASDQRDLVALQEVGKTRIERMDRELCQIDGECDVAGVAHRADINQMSAFGLKLHKLLFGDSPLLTGNFYRHCKEEKVADDVDFYKWSAPIEKNLRGNSQHPVSKFELAFAYHQYIDENAPCPINTRMETRRDLRNTIGDVVGEDYLNRVKAAQEEFDAAKRELENAKKLAKEHPELARLIPAPLEQNHDYVADMNAKKPDLPRAILPLAQGKYDHAVALLDKLREEGAQPLGDKSDDFRLALTGVNRELHSRFQRHVESFEQDIQARMNAMHVRGDSDDLYSANRALYATRQRAIRVLVDHGWSRQDAEETVAKPFSWLMAVPDAVKERDSTRLEAAKTTFQETIQSIGKTGQRWTNTLGHRHDRMVADLMKAGHGADDAKRIAKDALGRYENRRPIFSEDYGQMLAQLDATVAQNESWLSLVEKNRNAMARVAGPANEANGLDDDAEQAVASDDPDWVMLEPDEDDPETVWKAEWQDAVMSRLSRSITDMEAKGLTRDEAEAMTTRWMRPHWDLVSPEGPANKDDLERLVTAIDKDLQTRVKEAGEIKEAWTNGLARQQERYAATLADQGLSQDEAEHNASEAFGEFREALPETREEVTEALSDFHDVLASRPIKNLLASLKTKRDTLIESLQRWGMDAAEASESADEALRDCWQLVPTVDLLDQESEIQDILDEADRNLANNGVRQA